jgi:hypothetical protein
MPFSLKTQSKRYQIALLAGALTALAANVPQLQAGNCGCEVACGAEVTCGCDQPVCSCQNVSGPTCGVEVGCGVQSSCGCGAEVGCGAEPGCGCSAEPGCGCSAEPGCGAEVGCGIEPGCGCAAQPGCGCSAEPGCGIEMAYGEAACGCEAPCGCDACGTAKKTNCLTKAMGSIRGGFQRLRTKMSPRKPNCDVLCDDGCDAMMQGELMLPVPYKTYGSVTPAPVPMHASSGATGMAVPHVAPTIIAAPAASHHHHDHTVGSGVVVPSPHAMQSDSAVSTPQSVMNMGQPNLVPTPMTDPLPSTAPQIEESMGHEPSATDQLFESVSDPFLDEQASVRQKRGASISRRMPTSANPVVRRSR